MLHKEVLFLSMFIPFILPLKKFSEGLSFGKVYITLVLRSDYLVFSHRCIDSLHIVYNAKYNIKYYAF